jgi:hypothetical protein
MLWVCNSNKKHSKNTVAIDGAPKKIVMFMDVAMWEHCTFDSEIYRCGKLHYRY